METLGTLTTAFLAFLSLLAWIAYKHLEAYKERIMPLVLMIFIGPLIFSVGYEYGVLSQPGGAFPAIYKWMQFILLGSCCFAVVLYFLDALGLQEERKTKRGDATQKPDN